MEIKESKHRPRQSTQCTGDAESSELVMLDGITEKGRAQRVFVAAGPAEGSAVKILIGV